MPKYHYLFTIDADSQEEATEIARYMAESPRAFFCVDYSFYEVEGEDQ